MPIVGVSWLIVWLDRKLRFPLPFPRDLEQLAERKPWLIDEMKKNKVQPSDAVIECCEVTPLKQEIIFRFQ